MSPGENRIATAPAATSPLPPSGQAVWVRVGAGAALVGGCLWIAKGGAILVTGHQPPLMFEAAVFAFPVALRGLDALLQRREPAPHRAAATAATVALVVGVALVVLFAVVDDPPDVVTSLAAATMGLATVTSLLLLGAACRRSGGLPAPWARLPWVMALALLPSMTVVGGVLAAIHERLLELPIVAYGVAWVILGYAMLAAARAPFDAGAEGGSVK
jgi:cytochrome bd-type quinol oxidase subunit 2